jgi:hypothetical protein
LRTTVLRWSATSPIRFHTDGRFAMTRSSTTAFAIAAFLAAVAAPVASRSESTGTSCADCPNYQGAFSLENSTGVTINYMVRWGNKHPWKKMALQSGHVMTHRYPLGEDKHAKAPTPYVRFDRVGGDNAFTAQEYRMEFYAVGYAGFGPNVNRTEPKRYAFKYSGGRNIDIKAQ